MKFNAFLAAVLMALTIGPLAAQPELVRKVEAQPGELLIPHEKWKLPNGLTVIIHEDHSDPIVHVEVTYNVGSARETPGKSGFAHFFEHMMFQGSENVADEEHFKIVNESGGTMNGTTNRDRTNYFETLPSNQLETALWLEADRMGFLLDAVTQKKFEVQRSTVKNEKEQRQGVPYGMLGEITGQTLYPPNHPYSWPVIGYVDDLDRADVNDLKNFFMRWYGPNNAILSVAGDVKPDEVLKLAEKYFGPIPKGPEVRRQRVDRVALGSDKYQTIEDRIFLPLTQMVFPTVPAYHRDEAALDLLADMLGDGNNSPFYKNFVKAEKANAAVVFHPTSQLAGEFTLIVQAFPNMKPSETEALIRSTIDEFEATGLTDEALARVKAARVSQFVDIMESVGSKSSVLTAWHLAKGNLEYNLDREVKRYERVTKENILAVFNKYVKGKKAAIVTVVRKPYDPNDKESKPVSFNPYANAIVKDDPSYEGLSYTKPTDNFDRSKRPAVGPAKAPVVPEFYTANFDNGLKIIGTQSSETPKTTILIEMKGGHMLEGDDLPLGTANLTASMMAEGSEKYTAEEFSAKLDLLGASVSVNSGRETVTIFVDVPSKNVDATMELLKDGLFNPKFAEEDFKRVKKQVLESVKNQKNSASYLANTAFNHLMYGNSILGSPTNGTEKTVEKIKLEHVKTYYDKYYSPKKANLVVVSSLPQAEIMAKLDWMKSWEAKDYELPEINAFPKYAATQIFLVDKPGALQSEIRVGKISRKWDAYGDYYKSNVANFALGGNFNSRLNQNLREDKGYTYGIRSGFRGTHYAGVYSVGASVRVSATDSSITEIVNEFNGYKANGISDEELSFTKNSIQASDARRYETGIQKAIFLNRIVDYGLSRDYIQKQNEILGNMSKADIDAIIKSDIDLDGMCIVVVGNAYMVKKKLEKLGYGKVREIGFYDANLKEFKSPQPH